jgi:hypothetical protein
VAAAALALALVPAAAQERATLTEQEMRQIAADAYIYAYPLVVMEVSRRAMTNVEAPDPSGGSHAPINQFAHMRAFPDASFTDVVRPNADTLYSSLWYDVSKEPLVISVATSGQRYFLLPMLDMWTDVWASPGTRTTGNAAQTFAIVGPRWQGTLPPDMEMLRSPTETGWMIGRTQTNGKDDYDNVHKFQASLAAVPLSAWGQPYTPPKAQVNPQQDGSAPGEQVAQMDAATFFATFAEATKGNPPHANDYPILQRMKRIGLVPGQAFDMTRASPPLRAALERAVSEGQRQIDQGFEHLGTSVNGWTWSASPIGTYGTDYLRRAMVAYYGLGANLSEDAIYPSTHADVNDEPLDSDLAYVIRFAKHDLPPANAFWSITLYNQRQFFADNPIGRYAIGDRDKLKYGADGSLEIYIQRDSPGREREANWLPAPKDGPFDLTMRLYWPKAEAFDGSWEPPPVERGEPLSGQN